MRTTQEWASEQWRVNLRGHLRSGQIGSKRCSRAYVDDITLTQSYGPGEETDTVAQMNTTLSRIVAWGNKWQVKFAPHKTQLLNVSRSSAALLLICDGKALVPQDETELVAIERAVQHALGRQEEVVVIHTDSMSALQVLRQPRTPMDNVQLTTAILGHIQGLAAQGRRVRFNWVPSHVGLRDNEAADEAADEAAREATRHLAVALTVLPSIHGAKVLARRAAVCAAGQQYRQLVQTSRQAAWHKQATNNNEPLRPAQQLSRAEEVVLHRLQVGYGTLEELRDGFEKRQCEHCPHMAPHPLTHYLLSCPATERLIQRVGPLEDAAALVRQFQKNLPLLLEVACAAPPPR
ncbi:hypothetical protein GWK47_010116 [Chionoecetes opilio]|uniref:RNase H type-1 domain-containing protein n=1 Tax=Chionoecetes opilio TaxID=41210 RepID=A0A8J5CPA4_CHIOP|nr:hypothetical protein GWK47_010116 [Chionoecetes opilio]